MDNKRVRKYYKGGNFMRKMQKRIGAFLLALAVVFTTMFSGVPQAVYAGTEEATGSAWTAGITDEAAVAAQKSIWMDTSKSLDDRVGALLSTMTLQEKAAQMVQPEQKESDGGATPDQVKALGIGSVLSGGGSAPATGNTAKDWSDRVNSYKAAALQSRLGIPLIYGVDAVHGNNNVDNTVIFPHNIGLGAAKDEALVEKVGAASAEEIRAVGVQWTFAPTLGVPDSERWGRYYECFGEEADIVSRLGAAYVRGFQGTTEAGNLFAANKVAATAKHYIGEGQTANGVNQGNVDMTAEEFDALMAEKNLLAPYEAAIAAGDRIVMVSYNSVDGLKCHGNKHLVTDILKGARSESNPLGLGFTGFVVSDYNGVDQLSDASYEAKVASSIDAGVDMFMEPYDWQNFINAVVSGYEAGTISAERIDDAVSRILRVKFEMGLFEEIVNSDTEKTLLSQIGSTEHREVAEEAVEKSLTVLKNDKVGETGKTALQILDDASKILVGGYKGNDVGAQCGGWTISWQGGLDSANGSGGNKVTAGTTVYEGFQQAAAGKATVSYNARGKVASGMDAAVIVVGEDPYAESNGDKTPAELTLTDTDKNVIKTAVDSAGDTPLVLVLMTGRPVAIADYVDSFDAIVEAWLPGTEGEGIANVMLDNSKDFAGTMPVTWAWYPQDIDSKLTDASKVLFPNGTGMKKDGTSIKAGGQTTIPGAEARPESPDAGGETSTVITRDGGVDLDAYQGKLEGEFCNPTSGTFSSYNISTGSENDSGASLGYAQWTAQSWGNAKWIAYIRQAGTYKVSARIKVTKAGDSKFTFGISTAVTGDGVDKMLTVPSSVTDGYQIVELGEVTIPETGLHGVKIMDGNDPGVINAKLDYLQFELVSPTGDKDDSTDGEVVDPGDETVPESTGNVISKDAVKVFMTSTEKSQNMSWYKYPTEMANQLSEKDALDITSLDDSTYTTINVDENKSYQEFLGMGTSLEEATINNLSQLTPEVQDEFLRKLVDPAQGGMTLFRITVGTSDFTAKPFYTYYDAKELNASNAIYNKKTKTYEPDWQNITGNGFSIQKDIDYKIVDTVKKVIALAKEYGVEDEVKFFASSWTPPGWMKNETSSSKSYTNNALLIKGGSLKDEAIDDLATYYVRYLEEYAKQGINIYAMTLQNEPMLEINYPSCAMSGEQEGKLAVAIKKAVTASSILNASQKECKLWAFDHNPGDAYAYVQKILSVDGANDALDGVAFHDYGGSLTNMQTVLDELLNKDGRTDQTVNLTERSVWGTAGANSIITYFRNSGISYNSWVTMLDSNVGVHQWVGTPDPTMFARAAGSDNDYWAMPEFYITGQFARFIRPGFVRVDSNLGSTSTVTNVVFKNPETGEMSAVVVNATDRKQNFKIVSEGTQFIGAIPAGNVATYVWSNPKNVQNSIEKGFAADAYNEASEGVTADADHAVTMKNDADYADYIINVKEAGTYNIKFNELNNADNKTIKIYQGDTLLREIKVLNHSDAKTVQGAIELSSAGVQQIRVQTSAGVKLSTITLNKVKAIHQVPGRIPADQFCEADAGLSIASDHTLGDMSWWSNTYYKVNVPADDTYTLTLSSATANTKDAVGFVVKIDGKEDSDEVAKLVNNVDWSNGGYNASGAWDKFTTTSVEIPLTQGEHIIGIRIAAPINIEWLALGSSMDLTADEITEGAEDGKVITADITGGTIPEETELADGTKLVTVTGLPTGVTATTELVGTDKTSMKLTLHGNSKVDFDEDKTVEVAIQTKQSSGKIYPTTQSFKITAVDDEESVAVTTKDTSVPAAVGDTKTLTLKMTGGTFCEDQISAITAAGDATAFYSIKSVKWIDTTTVDVELTYNKAFYRSVNLDFTVPAACYDDGSKNLTTSVTMNPVDGLPTAMELSDEKAVTLTEDKAYANSGSLAANVAAGNYTDYFLDVKEAGTYMVTYTMNTLTSDGTAYDNAWEVNRGVAGTLGTNSYKQVDIPGLWINRTIKMRHAVELSAGLQTLEFKAKSGGYKIDSIEVAPVTASEVAGTMNEATTILADSFYDVTSKCIIDGSELAYTVAGTAFDYKVDVKEEGTYELKMNYAIESNGSVVLNATRSMKAGTVALGSVALPATGAWSTYKDSNALTMDLPEGSYTIHLALAGDGANIKQFTLTRVGEKQVDEIPLESIAMDKTNASIEIGQKVTLNPVFAPVNASDKNVLWTSDNASVATVTNGIVTAKSVGTTTIHVTSMGDSAIHAECVITVKEAPKKPVVIEKVPATSVKLNVKSKTIYKGKTYTLKATVGPKNTTDKLTWSSSKPKIAKVNSSGKVSALKKGTATITVKTTSGKKATCKITVKEVKSTKVTLNKKNLTLKKGKTATLKATVTPKKSTDKITWSSSNKKVATVSSNGKVKALKKGTVKITVKTSSGKKATCKVKIK